MQTDGRVSHVSGQALSRLVVFGRHRIPLKHRKSRAPSTEKDFDHPVGDLLLGQQSAQQAVPKQQHDLDRIRLADWESRPAREARPQLDIEDEGGTGSGHRRRLARRRSLVEGAASRPSELLLGAPQAERAP